MNTVGKPGWKSSEFWMAAAASAVGLFMASGAFGENSAVMQCLGMVASVLSALGYGVSRGMTKAGEARGAALVEAARAAKKSQGS